MDDMTESETTIAWLWIIEAMASFKEVSLSLIRDLLQEAPELPCGLAGNVKERVALRCLEDLCARQSRRTSEISSSQGLRIEFDVSESCENVLQRIVKETPECDLQSGGPGLSKYDILSFIRHKEPHFPKLALEKLRDSIIDGTHPYADFLREKSGLESARREDGVVMDDKNRKNPVISRPNLTYNDVGKNRIEVISDSLVIQNKDKQLESNLQNGNLLPSKRGRSDSGGGNNKADKLENHDGIDSSDAQNVNTKKAKCQVSDDNQSSEQNLVPLREKEPDKEASTETERNILVTTSGHELAGSDMGIAEEEKTTVLEGGSNDLAVSKKPNEECENTEVHGIGTKSPGNESQVHLSPDVPIEVNENRAEPSGFSTEEPASKNEHNVQFQEPNSVANGGSQGKNKTLEENNNGEGSREAEISSDVDGIHDVWTDVAEKKHKFMSSQTIDSQHNSLLADSSEQNLCMKCNKAGQALACNSNNCQVVVHEKCLGSTVIFDGKGSFYCPFCAYSLVIAEYLESKKISSVSRKNLSAFIRRGSVEPQPIKSSIKKKKHREGLCKENLLGENQKEGIRVATNVNEENGCKFQNVTRSYVLSKEKADLKREKGKKAIISGENTDTDLVNKSKEDSEARPKKNRPEKSLKKKKKHRKGLCEDENPLGENKKEVHLEEKAEENRSEFLNVTESSALCNKIVDLERVKGKKKVKEGNKVLQKSDDLSGENAGTDLVNDRWKDDSEAQPKRDRRVKSLKKKKRHSEDLRKDKNLLGENQKDVHLEEKVEENCCKFLNVAESSALCDKNADLVRKKGKKVIKVNYEVPQKSDNIVNTTKADSEAWQKIVDQKDVDAANQLAQEFSIDSSEGDDDDIQSSIAKYCIGVRERETRSKTYPVIPVIPESRRKIRPWTSEEEQKLKEGVEKYIDRSHIPWKKILEFGENVFLDCRTKADLHDKWRNMSKSSERKRRV